jgi:hypothetical protein
MTDQEPGSLLQKVWWEINTPLVEQLREKINAHEFVAENERLVRDWVSPNAKSARLAAQELGKPIEIMAAKAGRIGRRRGASRALVLAIPVCVAVVVLALFLFYGVK